MRNYADKTVLVSYPSSANISENRWNLPRAQPLQRDEMQLPLVMHARGEIPEYYSTLYVRLLSIYMCDVELT